MNNQVVKVNKDYEHIKIYPLKKQLLVEYKLDKKLNELELERLLPSIITNDLKVNNWTDLVYKHVESLNDLYLLITLR